MNQVAILTDSNSGITQAEAKDYGIYVIPMPFYFDDEVFYEDIDLTQDEFYEKLEQGSSVKTSMPTMGDVIDTFEELLEEFKQVVYIPMSSGLSGSYEAACLAADDYDGDVVVVNNKRVSVTMRESVLDAKLLADAGKDANEIRQILEDAASESSIYIALDTLEYLKKGGRLTPTAAALGSLLRIKPVLTIQGDKLDSFAKARTIKQSKAIMIDAVRDDIEKRFGGDASQCEIAIAHTNNYEMAEEFKQEVLEIWPDREIVVNPLALSVSCHIGPGALALTVGKRISL